MLKDVLHQRRAEVEAGEFEAQETTQLLHLLNRFSVDMTAVVDRAMGTDYASNPEILCIVALSRSDGLTFSELMALSGLPRRSVANLAKLLDRLVLE